MGRSESVKVVTFVQAEYVYTVHEHIQRTLLGVNEKLKVSLITPVVFNYLSKRNGQFTNLVECRDTFSINHCIWHEQIQIDKGHTSGLKRHRLSNKGFQVYRGAKISI